MTSKKIPVILRIRPMNKDEKLLYQNIVTVNDQKDKVYLHSDQTGVTEYTFTKVYTEEVSTSKIYENDCRHLVEKAYSGHNSTIICYGITGSGKTYTMSGENDGIIHNALRDLFKIANSRTFMYASFLQIYMDQINDLIGIDRNKKLIIKNRKVVDLSEHKCSTLDDCIQLFQKGIKRRNISITNQNLVSSRSHTIFTIRIGTVKNDKLATGYLNFVDLAGSESPKYDDLADLRAEERKKINLSNFVLGQVITALSQNNLPPYRDSKLTTLLKDSLGGNGITIIVTNITPSSHVYNKTISSLNYAKHAQNISNKPSNIIFKDLKDIIKEKAMEIEELKLEVEELERRLKQSQENFSKNAIIINDDDFECETNILKLALFAKKDTIERIDKEKKDLEELNQQEEFKNQIEDLKNQAISKDNEIKNIKQELETIKHNSEKKIEKLKKNIELFTNKTHNMEEAIHLKEDENEKLRSEVETLKKIVAKKEKEVLSIKEERADIIAGHYLDEKLQIKISQEIRDSLTKKKEVTTKVCNIQ